MKRTISTNKRLYALITKLGIDKETKEEMVYNLTKGRTVHSSELTEDEAGKLIERLNEQNGKSSESRVKTQVHNELMQKMRRNVFKLMYDIGILNGSMDANEKLTYINDWIYNKLKLNKDLNALAFEELTILIRQLQAVRRNYVARTTKQVMYN